jgi:hypothetical protein
MTEQGGAVNGVLGRLRTHELASGARTELLSGAPLSSPRR